MRAMLITKTVSLADTETPLEKAELPVPVPGARGAGTGDDPWRQGLAGRMKALSEMSLRRRSAGKLSGMAFIRDLSS